MDNRNNNQLTFDNLKKLSQLLSGNEFNAFVGGISKARKALDAYCKQLKDRESALATKPSSAPATDASVAPVRANTAAPKTAPSAPNKFNNPRPNNFAPRKQGEFFARRNRESKEGANARGDRRPINRTASNGTARPVTGKPRPFVSRAPEINVVQKPERSIGNKNKSKSHDNEGKGLNIKAKIRMGYIDLDNFGEEERMGRVRKAPKKQKQVVQQEKINIDRAVITTDNLTVKILSEKIGKPAVDIIKKFMMLGMMPSVNSVIDFATAELVASEFGVTLEKKMDKKAEEQLEEIFETKGENLQKRPPIVTVMGHVDHGKTSLLDAIRKTNVSLGEAGGITQHIGAYSVDVGDRKITFIDTPGHEAFTSMRARGAKVTDIAILVVAADDGIMPQTIEAINHIKAAGVPMIVAINKMDRPEANVERIKQQLAENDVLPEEWGGSTICVPISAKTHQGIDKLLEMVLLVADVEDFTADPTQPATGYVIESKIDKGRGIMATVLVRNGTLHVGDYMVSGIASGRVRAMMDYNGKPIKQALPSTPVSVLGFNKVPVAGDKAYVVDEKLAKSIVAEREIKLQEEKSNQAYGVTLEDFLKQSADHEIKILNIIVKTDVNGTAEALKQTLERIHNDEVNVKCIHAGVGSITEGDVALAQASNAVIIGFNVKPESKARANAEHNGVDIKLYSVIYDAVDDVTNAINGMLTPKYEENIIGHAEIRHIFKISSVGTIAGCYVLDGNVARGAKVHLKRGADVVAETEIETLQQQKDEAKSVKAGFECGIKLRNFNDIKEGDIIEAFELKRIN